MTQPELLQQFNSLIATSRAFQGIPADQQDSLKKEAQTATAEQLQQMIAAVEAAEKKMPSLEEEQKNAQELSRLVKEGQSMILKYDEAKEHTQEEANLKNLEAEFSESPSSNNSIDKPPKRKKFLGIF